MKPRVIVTDSEQRSVLAACRSLAAGGYDVTVAGTSRMSAAGWSRASRRALPVPDPREDRAGFVGAIAAELAARGHAVIIPGTDASLAALSEGRDRVEPQGTTGLPPACAVARALDKIALLEAAARAGLGCPESVVVKGRIEAQAAARQIGFPVVVKPARSEVRVDGRTARQSARLVEDEETLARIAPDMGCPIVLQRYDRAPRILSFAGVVGDGALLVHATSRYLRTWPPGAGSASMSETADPVPELVERAQILLADVGWQGIFELELLDRGRDGLATLDLNPRLYGSIALAIDSGADLPRVWCDWLLGRTHTVIRSRACRRYRWEEGEIRNAVWLLSRGRLRELLRVARPYRAVAHPHFRVRDPAPFVAWMLGAAVRAARRLRS